MKIENYYLDLGSLSELEDREKEIIHSYYRDMLHSFNDNRRSMAESMFHTLYSSGYLKEVRDEKLNKLLS